MKAFCVLLVVLGIWIAKCVNGDAKTLVLRQESGENENLHFAYDGHTHVLIFTRQAMCYIFTLTDEERATVHTNAGLRNLELKVIGQLSDPNVQLTTVPRNVLHTNILRECGKGVINYHIIQ